MLDDKRQQQIEQEKLKEIIDNERRKDQASYQPEKSELDDDNPPQEDSE
jgi:hypothetical protein